MDHKGVYVIVPNATVKTEMNFLGGYCGDLPPLNDHQLPASTVYLFVFTAILATVSLVMFKLKTTDSWFSNTGKQRGPIALPFLGHLHLLAWRPNHSHLALKELADSYGEFFHFQLGSKKTVVLNSYELIKDVFYRITDRPAWFLIRQVTENCKGLVWQSGHEWKELRRFSHMGLKNLSVGDKTLEERVQEEVYHIIDAIKEMEGQAFNPAGLLQQATSNITCSLCFGNRFSYKDGRFCRHLDMIKNIFTEFSLAEPINFFPFLENLPYSSRVRNSFEYMKAIDELISEQIKDHRETFDPDQPRDFVDLYLTEELHKFDQNEAFTDVNIRLIIRDLFIAGSETTATTLQWLLLYMALHPDIQRKCQREIDNVLGSTDELPPFSVKLHLSYTEATILEVQRMTSVVPFLLHQNNGSTKIFRGYAIPRGTAILANVYAVHMSEAYWDSPEVFRPERFIDAEGDICRHKRGFLPFGIGPRQCPGEYLAKMELFFFFTILLHRFDIKLADEKNPPTSIGKTGVTLAPEEHSLRFIKRKSGHL